MAKKKSVDYRDFKTVEKRNANAKTMERAPRPEKFAGFWWCAPEQQLHSAVWAAVDSILGQQDSRRAANRTFERLYEDDPASAIARAEEDKVTMNVIRMAADTLCAKISKQKPKTAFVTDGGDWGQQRRARKLDKYVEGTLYRADAHAKSRDEFRDACVKDFGAEKWFLAPNGIQAERVLPEQILVDRKDGQYGTPRCMYQYAAVHREVLRGQIEGWAEEKAITPEKRDELITALEKSSAPEDETLTVDLPSDSLGDMVEVRESWHLPSRPVDPDDKTPKTDGRHVLCISDATLIDEPWVREDFPFVITRFSKRMRGFEGSGVAAQLVRWQRSINKKLRKVNVALERMANGRVFLEEFSEVNERHITNEEGSVIRYRGQAPIFQPGVNVPSTLLESVETDIRRALESVGVSQMDVAAKKPSGLDSAPSLREWSDIASERFILVGQGHEETFVARSRQVMALSREAKRKGQKLEALTEGRRGLERLSWDQVEMDEESFILKALPTSSLPTTPAARKQTVQEWLEMGWVDGLTARRLMDMPDLEAANNVAFAAQEDIEYALEDMLDGKGYEPPEPMMDLAYGVKRFQSAYLRSRRQNCPEDILGQLQSWITQAMQMLNPPAPPAPALPMEIAPAAAMGAPVPPVAGPVSPVLPPGVAPPGPM